MSEVVLLVAVLGAIGGAILNTIRGFKNSDPPENYNIRKLLGAIIAPIFAGITIGQNLFSSLPPDVSLLATLFSALTAGFAVDVAISGGKKD